MTTADPHVKQHNPFEGLTEDDPNFAYKEHYERYNQLVNDLPSGWKKGDRQNGPPYIHEDGHFSYKNPNWYQIKLFMNEMRELKHKIEEESMMKEKETLTAAAKSSWSSWRHHPKRSMIKKLRLMLKAGAPLEAVQRRAAVEDIDMDLVLQQQDEDTSKHHVPDDADADADPFVAAPAPPILLKKYQRMLKAGIPLPQVQQLASVEANMSPEQVVVFCAGKHATKAPRSVSEQRDDEPGHQAAGGSKIKADNSEITTKNSNSKNHNRNQTLQSGRDRAFVKLRMMHKAGSSKAALEFTAEMLGISMEDLEKALSVDENKTKKDGSNASLDAGGSESTTDSLPFTKVGSERLSFDASSDLAGLVRKMAQTVQKSSRVASSNATKGKDKQEMEIDLLTLYHALGSFQGVQVARDRYNATTGTTTNNSMKLSYIRSQREAFAEMARSIGLGLPKDVNTPVDIFGLDELIHLIENKFKTQIEELQSLISEGFYNFDSLAVLFRPGSRVLVKNAGGGGVDTLAKVSWNRYEQGRTILGQPMKFFNFCMEFVAAVDSNAATICEVVEGMDHFEGKRSLTGGMLQFVPLSAFSTDHQEALLERYRRRGELYNRVALNVNVTVDASSDTLDKEKKKTYSYMAYQKGCFFAKRSSGGGLSGGNSTTALATDGRIIIDARGASDWGHSLSVGYDPFVTGIHYKVKEYKLQMRYQSSHQTQGAAGGKSKKGLSDDCGGDAGMIIFDCVPFEYLEFTWPLVVGFSLTAKTWGDCLVDGLDDIYFQPDVFDRLVLPSPRKRLIQALVKNTGRDSGTAFHDLIAGKGEGSVFLLYGPPGVGKTLTAEATSEVLRRPLYALSMGCMGTTADELERRLSEILKLSAKWDAIILLDEADAFLETRSSSSSLEKNAMVGVMLKLVEYFSGILFLTSNRLDSIDPAFKTRITLALKYDHLDVEAREQIWINLLKSSGVDLTAIDTRALASCFVLNGREIKNALRLALALAAEDGSITPSHSMLMETSAMVGPYQDDDNDKNGKGCFFPWWK